MAKLLIHTPMCTTRTSYKVVTKPDQLAELRQHLAVSRALKRGEKHHQSNADPHAAMTLQTARSTTHVRRSTVPQSGHKSGHRACRRAIPYSETRVARGELNLAPIAPFVKVVHAFHHDFGDTNALFVLTTRPPAQYNDHIPHIRSWLAFFTKWAQKWSQK